MEGLFYGNASILNSGMQLPSNLLLSSYIFWIRNKQKKRITWKQMHWFLVEQSSKNHAIYQNSE